MRECEKDRSHKEHNHAYERPDARVEDAGLKNINAGCTEEQRGKRIERNLKVPVYGGVSETQYKERHPGKQEEKPENRGGVVHHGDKAVAG